MAVTVAEQVDRADLTRFWELYEAAFTPLASRAASREMLSRAEFTAMMNDRRVLKYVARDDDGDSVGLATLAREVEAVPWLSVPYFRRRWPQEYAEGRLYYVGFLFTHPAHQGTGLLRQMVRAVVRTLAEARAVTGFDISGYNRETYNLLIGLMRRAGPEVVPDVISLDEHVYYAVTFRASGMDGEAGATRDGRAINLDAEAAGRGLPNR